MLTNPPRQIFCLYELWDSIIHEPIRDGFSCRLFLYLYWVIMLRSLHVCMTVGGRIRLVYLISSLVSLPQIVCWNPFISTSISFAQVAARRAGEPMAPRHAPHADTPKATGPVSLPPPPPFRRNCQSASESPRQRVGRLDAVIRSICLMYLFLMRYSSFICASNARFNSSNPSQQVEIGMKQPK